MFFFFLEDSFEGECISGIILLTEKDDISLLLRVDRLTGGKLQLVNPEQSC